MGWQVYRLLCKRALLEAEMITEFAGLQMLHSSFTSDHIYAPVPGSTAENRSRRFGIVPFHDCGGVLRDTVECGQWWRRVVRREGNDFGTSISRSLPRLAFGPFCAFPYRWAVCCLSPSSWSLLW